jgi:hypothetical protein
MNSNWLCLQLGGGAAKGPGVTHVCQLCQCRSDDVFLPNLLACGKCIVSKGKIGYVHQKLIDDYDIAHAKQELERLDRCPIMSIVGCACVLQTGGCQDYYKLHQQLSEVCFGSSRATVKHSRLRQICIRDFTNIHHLVSAGIINKISNRGYGCAGEAGAEEERPDEQYENRNRNKLLL